MRFEDERYVRVFTRDTPNYLALPFESQAVLPLLMRKLDRSGRLPIGRHGPAMAVALTIGAKDRLEFIRIGIDALLADETLVIEQTDDGDVLWMPKFKAAQEAVSSGALRTQTWREKKAAEQSGDETSRARDAASRGVTNGDAVTLGDAPVTPCRAVPSGAVPVEASAEAAQPPSSPPPAKPASPVVTTVPVVGGGAAEHPVTEADLEPLAAAYPGVDITAEVLKARAWLIANPSKRKTPRGVPRFLHNWCDRAQNSGRRNGARGPPARGEERSPPPLPLL